MIGNINLPDFTNGISNPDTWINQILNTLGFCDFTRQPIPITGIPSTIFPGVPYLILAGSTYSLPGNVVIFLSSLPSSAVSILTPVNTVIGAYTNSASNWVQSIWVHGAVVRVTSTGALTIPSTFDGVLTLVVPVSGVTLVAPGKTLIGAAGLPISIGVHQVYQNSTTVLIS